MEVAEILQNLKETLLQSSFERYGNDYGMGGQYVVSVNKIADIINPLIVKYDKPQTNGDHIHSMTNNELRMFIQHTHVCERCDYYNDDNCDGKPCRTGILKWLESFKYTENE